jgi:hypothetical protein
MPSSTRPSCPICKRPLTFELPADGKGQRSWQCLNCDGLDPLKSKHVIGWLQGELARKDQAAK